MALQEQHVAFKFAGGVETKMDPKAVPAVRLLDLQNGVFTRAISIKKRNGYELLSRAIEDSASPISGAKRLAKRDDELLLFTDNRCYSKQSDADQWTDAGALVAPLGQERPAVTTGTAQTMPDHATAGGITVYAWEDSLDGVYWTVVDEATGRIYRAPTQADSLGQRPRCVAVGNIIHIYYAVPTLSRVMVMTVNPATPSASVTASTLIEDLSSSNPVFDACPTTRTGTPALIAWHEHATTDVRIGYVDASGVLGSPTTGHPSVARLSPTVVSTTPIAVAYRYVDGANGDHLFLSYVTSTAQGIVRTLNGGSLAAGIATTVSDSDIGLTTAVSVQRIALAVSSTHAWVAFEEAAVAASNRYCMVNSVAFLGAASSAVRIRSVGLASRAFQAGNATDVFAVFVHDTTYFNVYLTLRLSDFAPAGRHLVGSAAGAPTRTHLSSVVVTDDVATVVLPYKTRLASLNNDKFGETALSKVTMSFDDADTHQTAQTGRGLTLAAACPQHYDGRLWTEQGFHVGPELVTAVTASGGSMTVSSTYLYVVWYEWTDAQGEIHRGPTSIGTEVVTGGADTQVTLTLPMLRVTRKTNVRICVGRSLPGATANIYRVTSLDSTTDGAAANGYVANATGSDTVSFVDRMSDADLIEQEEIYTVGGILSNDPVSLGSHVAAGKNRLFFTDAQAGSVVRFSKRVATGFGVEFAPELMYDIDPDGGDITSLATMDDVVFAFKASSIYAFNGDGPYENGSNTSGGLVAGFSSSQLITSDVGCTDPSSIVLTPKGLMFKSSKGIYMLSRSREVTKVGSPVETYDSQNVRRAVVLPDRTAVLFLTDSGSSLYYDYEVLQWSRFTNHEGYDGIVVDNEFYYLRTNDIVFKETPGVHSDGGARITLTFETAWLHLLEHLQGFQRFWKLLLLGTRTSPHQLAVSHRMSYEEQWSDPYYLDATGDTSSVGWITGDSANPIGEDPIDGTAYGEGDYGEGDYGGDAPGVYQWRYGIHEDGQAVQFRFEDFEKAGLSGASFELTEMTITGGVKKSDMRPFSAARST